MIANDERLRRLHKLVETSDKVTTTHRETDPHTKQWFNNSYAVRLTNGTAYVSLHTGVVTGVQYTAPTDRWLGNLELSETQITAVDNFIVGLGNG